MTDVCEPVDWQIFNVPSVESVQYYLILKKKREFSQLVKDYDSQISKQSFIHYSCIAPGYSYLNSKKEMLILLFDGLSNASFIGLRVKVSNKSLVHERSFLLCFLKKLEKKLFYHAKENYVLIQCETADVWELFYLLYNMYLRQYKLTIIGTDFFNFYMYSHFIKKDIQLLQMLYNGSKIIKIDKKSIFYKLLHQTKISICTLVHVLTNMPKGIVFSASNFAINVSSSLKSKPVDLKYHLPIDRKMISELSQKNAEVPYLNLDFVSKLHENIFISSTSKPKISEVSNVYKYSKESFEPSVPTKRKFQEIDNTCSNAEIFPATSKCPKISTNFTEISYESHWEKYCDIKSFPVNSYSDIPIIQCLLPKLLNGSENCDLNFNNRKENCYLQKEIHSLKCVNITSLKNMAEKSTYEITNKNLNNDTRGYCDNFGKTSRNSIHEAFSCAKPSHFANDPNDKLFIKIDNSQTASHKFNILSDTVKDNISDDISNVDFVTASGKTINVSHAAMLTASKMLKDMLDDELPQSNDAVNFTVDENKFSKNRKPFKNPTLSKESSSSILHDESFQLFSNIHNTFSNRTAKNIYNDPSNNSDIDDVENSGFTTAAGKIVSVSSSSVQAASKILQEVLNETNVAEEINTHHSTTCTEQQISTVVAGSTKFVSHEMDKMEMDGKLVEHFFAESPFDICDINLEVPMECNSVKNISMAKEECNTMKSAIQKPRKSLGGRRSKIYTNML